MDKKELLKRWALAYTEPSLFYVPWRENKEIYVRILNTYGDDDAWRYVKSNEIVGGIFSPEGKLVTKVTFDGTFYTYLKPGTYIYKEAVSPIAHELADDVIFTISRSDSWKNVNIPHRTTQSFYSASYVKNENMNITSSDGMIIYDNYKIIVRHYALKDGQGLHSLVLDNNQPLIREIMHNENDDFYKYSDTNFMLRETKITEYNYPYQQYGPWRYSELRFGYYVREPTSSIVWWINSQTSSGDGVENRLEGQYLTFSIDTYVRVSDNPTAKEQWILTVTKERLLEIYDFIINNNVEGWYWSGNGFYFYRYTIYIDESGNYYKEHSSNTPFGISADVYGKRTISLNLPRSVTLQESEKISENVLEESNLILANYMSNTEKYFHGMTKSDLLDKAGRYSQYARILTKPQVNQEVLDIINNSESGGET